MAAPGSQRFAASISQHPVAATAIGEVVGEVLDRVGPAPELAMLFVTAPHLRAMGDFVDVVRAALAPRVLLGATATSVVGGAEEVEGVPAVTLWAGRVGSARGVRLDAFHDAEGWSITGLPRELDNRPRTLVLLADSSSFPTDAFVRQVSATMPNLTVVGGLASAGTRPSANRLVLDHLLLDDGAVGVLLDDADTEVVVSQGCRPIGEPFIVTRSEGNFIQELGGRPALDRLQELIDAAPPDERALLARGIHIGIVVDEHREAFGRGDFVVRNVLGAQKTTGAIAIGDLVAPGVTVQFQVRDARSANEDLQALVDAPRGEAALLFTCNGRGEHLFGIPHHDAALVSAMVRGGAVGGMFCAGEIGPIGGQNFLHGFTAAVVLFR